MAMAMGYRVPTEVFGLLIHAGLKHERRVLFHSALRNPVGLMTHSRLRPQVCCSVMGRQLDPMETNPGDFFGTPFLLVPHTHPNANLIRLERWQLAASVRSAETNKQ